MIYVANIRTKIKTDELDFSLKDKDLAARNEPAIRLYISVPMPGIRSIKSGMRVCVLMCAVINISNFLLWFNLPQAGILNWKKAAFTLERF